MGNFAAPLLRKIAAPLTDEEMWANLPDDLDLASGFVGRVQPHEAIEPAVQVGLVSF